MITTEDGHIATEEKRRFVVSFISISPTSDGAGAAILASEDFVRKHQLETQAVEILAQEMVTDFTSTFEENSCIKMVRRKGNR